LSATIGLFTFLLALSFARIGTATERIGIWVTCCVVLLFAFLETGANFIGRLATTTASLEQRQDVWRSTVGLILQRPLTGTGYGTFEDAFRVGRDLSIISVYDKAHNTYLELGLELGIPATCLLVLAVGLIVLASIAGARARDVDNVVCCVAVGASALVAVHSLVDFSLQMPAVAVTFALLLGTAFGQFAAPRRKAKVAPASRSFIDGPGAPLR
jgi:O-antigen ligase